MARSNNVNASSIAEYMQSLSGRYKKNWMGSTKRAGGGKLNVSGEFFRLDPNVTPVEDAVALFNQGAFVELLRRPEGNDTFLRLQVLRDDDTGDVWVQLHSYVRENVTEGITDVVELSGPTKDEVLQVVGTRLT